MGYLTSYSMEALHVAEQDVKKIEAAIEELNMPLGTFYYDPQNQVFNAEPNGEPRRALPWVGRPTCCSRTALPASRSATSTSWASPR